jgi:hypothetical protein
LANARLKNDGRFSNHPESIQIDFQEGLLIVTGRVPSFYLKSVLQTVLDGLPGVRLIDNRVDVVSSMGLSSTQRHDAPGGQGPLGWRA